MGTTSNSFEEWKKSVFAFCGLKATESISSYFKKGFTIGKTVFPSKPILDFHGYKTLRTRTMPPERIGILNPIDLENLRNLHNYAKSGNLDALHAFLILQQPMLNIKQGVYEILPNRLNQLDIEYDDTILLDILQAGNRGDNDTLNISEIPALLVIVAEHSIKMQKYKELGYEYCLLEAGMMLQNLYVGVNPSLAVRPMGSYDKERTLRRLKLSPKYFTPMITALIGTQK